MLLRIGELVRESRKVRVMSRLCVAQLRRALLLLTRMRQGGSPPIGPLLAGVRLQAASQAPRPGPLDTACAIDRARAPPSTGVHAMSVKHSHHCSAVATWSPPLYVYMCSTNGGTNHSSDIYLLFALREMISFSYVPLESGHTELSIINRIAANEVVLLAADRCQ
jgi:hypothetical protein